MTYALLKDLMVIGLVILATIGIASLFALVLKQSKRPDQRLRRMRTGADKKYCSGKKH